MTMQYKMLTIQWQVRLPEGILPSSWSPIVKYSVHNSEVKEALGEFKTIDAYYNARLAGK